MRVLAVDHGAARCGCAVSDPSGTIARPLEPISPTDPAAVAALATELDAALILVGLPVSLDGSEGEQAAAARAFAAAVGEAAGLPVEAYDERLTTKMAITSRRRGSAAAEDSLAAAHLLESWLAAAEARR